MVEFQSLILVGYVLHCLFIKASDIYDILNGNFSNPVCYTASAQVPERSLYCTQEHASLCEVITSVNTKYIAVIMKYCLRYFLCSEIFRYLVMKRYACYE